MRKEAEVDISDKGYAQTGIVSLLTCYVSQSCNSTQIQRGGELFYLSMGSVKSYSEGACGGEDPVVAILDHAVCHTSKSLYTVSGRGSQKRVHG